MKISELPEPLKSLAEKRREQRIKNNLFNDFTDELGDAFGWESTLEGFNFWFDVNSGIDVYNHPMYPKFETKLFLIIEDLVDEYQTLTHIIEAIDKEQALEACGIIDNKIIVTCMEIIKTGKPTIHF